MPVDKLGRPLKDLRISVTDRCNFRCPYCMPAEKYSESYEFLPKRKILSYEEIARLASIFVRLGVSKIRLTGGEPLLREDLHVLVSLLVQIKGVDDLALTTNGYLLESRAQGLIDAGLKRVTISLDSLDEEVFARMNGRGFGPQKILDAIRRTDEVGFRSTKINAVIQKGVNDHTLVDMARYFKDTGHIVRFIEYMDVGNRNGWRMDDVVRATEIHRRINEVMPLEPMRENYPGEVADRYRYLDGIGEIGIIPSVTKPFCGDCTRARLSPEGGLYTCLFATQGVDLQGPMRAGATDDQLEDMISGFWGGRVDRYSEVRASMGPKERAGMKKVEMYHIGG